MKKMALFIVTAGVGAGLFSYWGLFTTAGRREFDEMAGTIPLLAGVGSILLLFCGVILWVFASRR